MSQQQKTYSLTLSEFRDYLSTKTSEMRACYQETEEIQFQFNDIFKSELAAWQEQFKFCFPRVMTQRRELPPDLVSGIDQAEKEELAKLQQEADTLREAISQSQSQSDGLLRQAQSTAAQLREANPELNAQEEELKAKLQAKENEFARAYEQVETLEKGLGWLVNGAKIAKLKKKQSTIKASQGKLLVQLRDTRKTWQAQLEQTAQTQADLRQEWEQKSVTALQSQARLDHITANLADLAQQQAITRVLSDLDASPGVEGELGEALDKLVERNKTRKSYEQGLRSVAEALGLTKGVADGMERFTKSVEGVVEEQTRFSLKDVAVILPQWVINVVETWKPLRDRVKDEKYLGTHPLEFSQIIKSYITDRLPDEIIQRFFETMGEALNAATKAWN
ncbi:MAG: hypothetical protein LLG44_02750 [Chloroflexi bacterium]|nr:hypothetical protein [Chloroflexota bacterium]